MHGKNTCSHGHGSQAIVSLVRTWMGDHLRGSIMCCCESCRLNTAGYGSGIKSSFGAGNVLPVPEPVGLPCDVASISEAPITQTNQLLNLNCSRWVWVSELRTQTIRISAPYFQAEKQATLTLPQNTGQICSCWGDRFLGVSNCKPHRCSQLGGWHIPGICL